MQKKFTLRQCGIYNKALLKAWICWDLLGEMYFYRLKEKQQSCTALHGMIPERDIIATGVTFMQQYKASKGKASSRQ